MSNYDPVDGQRTYHRPPPPPERADRGPDTAHRTALAIRTVADMAAGLLVLWILLFLLDANEANVFVDFVRSTADWLARWSQDIFMMDTEGLRVILNYGLPALMYALVGHGIAARINRA
ncbi:hypothetical protein [Streptomyces sp. NPDC058739]|uniref:hypothetical protein n=1 Tax=Streptomyces sp. NPDC058739 TaxID=3346618 RepID=UPI003676B043